MKKLYSGTCLLAVSSSPASPLPLHPVYLFGFFSTRSYTFQCFNTTSNNFSSCQTKLTIGLQSSTNVIIAYGFTTLLIVRLIITRQCIYSGTRYAKSFNSWSIVLLKLLKVTWSITKLSWVLVHKNLISYII